MRHVVPPHVRGEGNVNPENTQSMKALANQEETQKTRTKTVPERMALGMAPKAQWLHLVLVLRIV